MAKRIDKNNLQINGLNIEDWIDRPSVTIGTVPEIITRTYDKKLVAFLDLLGVTDEVLSNTDGKEDKIISKMLKIKEIVEYEIAGAQYGKDISMLYISDSFIFVCDGQLLPSMLHILSNIQLRILIECKTMLRGALVYGDVIIEDEGKQIIGPAYIDAYLKQEKYAIYPRIIIGNSVIPLINEHQEENEHLVISQDREHSLDYVDIFAVMEKRQLKDITTKLRREGIIDYLCSNYDRYNKADKPSIRAKYAWTINYLKEKGVWPDAEKYHCW